MLAASLVRVGVLLLLAGASGCIPFVPIYYAYPSVSFVPGVNVGEDHEAVHAFRVDITEDSGCVECAGPAEFTLREIGIWPAGHVPAQGTLAVDHGFFWNCLALTFSDHVSHTVQLRLYRPGCHLIEWTSWDLSAVAKPLTWETTVDTADEEKALDNLLGMKKDNWQVETERVALVGLWPASGSATPEHRKTLCFVASEYERIATVAADRTMLATAEDGERFREIQERCRAKAKWVRERAEK